MSSPTKTPAAGAATHTRRLGLLGLLVMALAGCAALPPDSGFGSVQHVARTHLGKELQWVRTPEQQAQWEDRLREWLSRPLSMDDAVQIALLNHRGLQASLHELGIAQADVMRAAELPNPHLSLFRASQPHGDGREYKIEQALTVNLLALITMPQVIAIEQRRHEQAQRAVSLEVLRLAADTRKAYVDALAAEETLRFREQVAEAGAIAAELARRMAAAGNWGALQQAREHRFSAEAALGLAQAQRQRHVTRERLTRLLGLWGTDREFRLPARLPDPPATPSALPDVERLAIAQRIDLQMMRVEIDVLARQLGLTRTTRFINVFEIGPARVLEGERDAGYKRGYEISFELPLFDWGTARVARAQAIYEQALARASQAAIDARSQVREAYGNYHSAWAIAQHHRRELVPISERIAQENLLRYNGMLIGVFELLADARSRIGTVIGAIEANREFWLAQADLDLALLGRPDLPAPGAPAANTASAPSGAAH